MTVNNLKYSIYVTFRLEGFHRWPAAAETFPEVAFLTDRHRHVFHFKCYAHVSHTDRDEEFILLSRKIQKSLRDSFTKSTANVLEFGSMSCEDIGDWLLDQFPNLYKVDVSEDGENGAVIERILQ
jgi:hypothetical protein